MAKAKKAAVKAKSHAKSPAKKKTPPRKTKPKKTGRALNAATSKFRAPPVVEKKTADVKSNKNLNADLLNKIRDQLIRLRERITGQINFLATDNLNRTKNDNEISFRSEEQGTDNFDRDFALNRVSLEQDIVFEIDEAINRIKIGTYGVCESCSGAIEKQRILALPYSRMCVACQSKAEVGRKKFRTFEAPGMFPAEKNANEQEQDEES